VALAAVFVVDDKPGRPDVSERTARWRRRPGTRFRTARALRVRHNERATPGRVTAALADARYQVAAATAVREGRPAPERTTPCFADPRHGPSVTTGLYPPSGLTGPVPLCAACAATLAAGSAPAARSFLVGGLRMYPWMPYGAPWWYLNGYWGGQPFLQQISHHDAFLAGNFDPVGHPGHQGPDSGGGGGFGGGGHHGGGGFGGGATAAPGSVAAGVTAGVTAVVAAEAAVTATDRC
jgi:hypothetical protein